jgi:hypothetical protein
LNGEQITGQGEDAMNRNTILAAALALIVGLWGGMVLARGPAGGGGPGLFAGVPSDGQVRAANAPRYNAPMPDGMAFIRLRTDTSGEAPRACLEFSQALTADPNTNYADYLEFSPGPPVALEAVGNLLCIGGLSYTGERSVTIKAGLPSAAGEKTAESEEVALVFGDQPPFVGFAGNGVILPRAEADGLGIETVNVSKLALEVYRVSDRSLVRQALEQGEAIAEGSWDTWSMDDAGRETGVKVFEGEVPVAMFDPATKLDRRNQTVTTVFPLGAALKEFKPGAYVVRARDASPGAGAQGRDNDRPAGAYRWIVYTDMALQSFEGASGMDVVVRNLGSARPLSGVTLTLIAENNEELGRVRTDGEGRGRFNEALMKGEGTLTPRYVMAYGAGGDFAALDLQRPALDLSARDVGGRAAPGDVDVYMYTDRGIYRPGEVARVTGLIRDAAGRAIANRESTLVVYRPNGTEARRERLMRAEQAGAVIRSVPIDRSAPRGRWRVALEVDGQKGEAGSVDFSVEDFVPQRLKVEAKASEAPFAANDSRAIAVDAQFLYGAPGAGLPVEGEARVTVDPSPFDDPAVKGFSFGRVDESFDERFFQLNPTTTDGDGKAQLLFQLPDAPKSSLPLRARVVATVFEPGGRTVREGFSIPVRLTPRYIGLRLKGEAYSVPENGRGVVEVTLVDGAGQRAPGQGLSWTLVREDWSYDWYLDSGQWRWRRTGRDVPINAGALNVAADKFAEITQEKMKSGDYRLIVTDPASGAESSMRFYVGWGGGANDANTPDMVAVVPPTDKVKPGQGVRVQIKPPYAGEAQIVVASDRILSMKTMRVPAEGATLTLRADESWGAGVYVLATVMTPRAPATLPVPRRAVGVAYVPIDMDGRTLKVSLGDGMPTAKGAGGVDTVLIRPRTKVKIPLTITGNPRGERVRVTLAAVDEGILQLTKFQSPDPAAWYFGRKALGVNIKDDYGRLLNPNLAAPTIARQGGDGLGGEGLTTVPTKTVALWAGLVNLERGRTEVELDIPDFNGQLRLMAVAWSETAVGSDSEAATVRDPVVAELTLPRFLAPGDDAAATLELSNVEGPAGAYRVNITGEGAARMAAFQQSFNLNVNGQDRVRIPLSGAAAGLGRVNLTLQGPNGLSVTRAYDIQSRTPFMPITRMTVESQGPGASYALARDALSGFAPGEGKALVSYSPLRGIDAVPLLDALERYPYGCSEQLTSTTMPLLYANALASAAQKPTDPKLRARVQETVNRLLDRQGGDGAFGLWRAEDRAATPWLGAYVTDFLSRAKRAGYVVPNAPMEEAYKALRSVARLDDFVSASYNTEVYRWPGSNDTQELLRSRSAAYALYVLAKAGKADIGQLRYFNDNKLASEPSPLAKAHIAAALAHLGDRTRATAAFRAAENALGFRNTGDYYQTPLRDVAGVVALAAESGMDQMVDRLTARLDRETRDAPMLMTQEQSFMLMAVDGLLKRAGEVKVTVNGQALVGPMMADAQRIAQGITFANAGGGPLYRTVSLTGIPASAPGAASNGFSISKRVFRMDGGSAGFGDLRQGERVIVLLEGAPEGLREHPSVLVDLLPAGLEIEQVLKQEDGAGYGPESSDGAFPFLGRLTWTRVAEARDDRFVAAMDLRGERFAVGYIARAVTPGTFTLPAAQVEDMYRPGLFARTDVGRISIAPR